jgi:hypothetical protein
VQTALRVGYYGDPLPNTYYLKMTGYPMHLRITRGVWALAAMAIYANPVLFFLPLGLLISRATRPVVLLTAVFSAQVAYSAYVGGDAWEWWGGANRYVSVTMPLYFVLLAHALREGVDVVARWLGRRRARPVGARAAGIAWAALVAVSMLSFNALKGPRSLREWALIDPPMHAGDNARMVRLGLRLRETTPPDAVLGVRWAGALPYFARRPAVDLLGKADARIAHLPMHGPPASGFARLVGFWPGHLKWDYAWSIGTLRPDVVANPSYDEEMLAHLRGYHPVDVDGFTVYLRDDSRALPPR